MLASSIRKFFIAVIVSVTVSYSAFSQGCVVDSNNFELLSPASEYLPCIERNVPYSATIHIFAIPSVGFNVDSILITSFLGLPAGITYSLNPASGKLYPTDHGCVYLSGTTTDSTGSYVVDYNGFIFLQQGTPSFDYIRFNYPGILPEVSLRVIEQGAFCPNTVTGVRDMGSNEEINFSVYPNPATNELFIQTNNLPVEQLSIFNTVGNLVSQTNGLPGNRIDVSSLSNGIYIAEITTPVNKGDLNTTTVRVRWVKM